MAFGASCSNANSGTIDAYYDPNSAVCTNTVASYYSPGGNNNTARMRDHILGSASSFPLPSNVLLAQASQENGGPNGNWFRIGTGDCTSFIDNFVDTYNATSNTMSVSDVQGIDSINAFAAAWYLKNTCVSYVASNKPSYSDWQIMSGALSMYNAGANNTGYNEGYGLSVMFMALGDQYDTLSYTTYDGPQVPTSPTGTQSRYNTGSTYGPIYVPGFAVTLEKKYLPFGTNSSGRRVIILVADDKDIVNGLFIQRWLHNNGYNEAYLTEDGYVAAESANAGADCCVICMGGAAVTKIQNTASSLGYNLTEFTSFSAWESSSANGYIDASGSTYLDNYDKGLSSVQSASSAGWS